MSCRLAFALTVIVTAASGPLAAPASADITNPSAPAPSTPAAGVTGVSYTVAFNATNPVAFPQEIVLNAPAGTFTSADFSVRNVTTSTFLSDTPTITNAGATATLRINNAAPAIGANHRVEITVTNATNSTAGPHTWTIATTSDPAPITTPSYDLTTPQTIVSPSAPAPSTTAAGVTGVSYTVAFNASSTGGVVFPQEIVLNAPAGTFTSADFSVRNVTTSTFLSDTPTITNAGATATLRINNAAPAIGANHRVEITVTNATNSTAGPHTWTIATTSDPAPITTPSYDLTTPQTIVSPSAPAPSTTAAGVTGVSYTVAFNASSTGGVVFPQEIVLNAPAGTFTSADFSVRNVTTSTFLSDTPTITNAGATATLRINNAAPAIGANHRVEITVTNATNSTAGPHTWTIATTSDPAPITTPSYDLTTPQTIVSPSAPAPSTTAAGVTGVSYTVAFNASSTGGVVFPQEIVLNAPAGTFTSADFSVRNVTTSTFLSDTPTITNAGATATLRINNAAPAIGANHRVEITVTNATNSTAGPHTWTIATTSDPAPITTPSYDLTTPQTIVSPSAPAPSTTAAGVTGVSYTVAFNASSTGGVVFPQEIVLNAPAGTFTSADFSVRNVTTSTFLSDTPTITNAGATATLRINNAAPAIGANHRVEITVTNATNSTAGPHTWTIATTSDPAPITTPNYTLGTDTTPPDTTINSGPSGPTTDSTPTFTFTSNEPGSTFQCRIDATAFTACSSPNTTAALTVGPHTFEVLATDPSNNVETTAASRSFTVTAPPPADTTPPDTTITSGPSGPTADTTPTFEFTSSEPNSTFQCSIDAGPFLPCSSPFTTPQLTPGSHTFNVRAVDAAGNVDTSPAGTFGISAGQRTFTVQAVAPPVLAKRVNVAPVKGQVFVSVPAGTARASATVPGLKGRRFVALSQAKQIPVGSLLDTRRGTVRLTSASGVGTATQSSDFVSGVFQVLQSGKGSAKGLTELRLKGASFKPCATRGKRSSARSAASKRRIRRLRGNGTGRFRTRGRYSAATVRGTDWTVSDRCDGTLTKVARGSVAVRDFRRRKTVVVRAGKSYLARARK